MGHYTHTHTLSEPPKREHGEWEEDMNLLQEQIVPRSWPSPKPGSCDPSRSRPLLTIRAQDLNYSYTHRHETHTHTLGKAYTDPVDVFHKHSTQKLCGPFQRGHTHSSHMDIPLPPKHIHARPSHKHARVPVTHTQNYQGLPQIHGYVHTTREEYKCTHKSKAQAVMGVSCTNASLHPKEIPPHRPLPSALHLGKTRPRLAPLAPSPPWLNVSPALPAPACLGGAQPASSASCQLSRGHSALLAAAPTGCQPHPLLPGLPPQHLGPSLGSTLAHFCRQWARSLIPTTGV